MTTISIITPSFNQGEYIGQTFDCIRMSKKNLGPSLEYLVIDGGSTDATIECIKNNSDIIDYSLSEKDDGQVDAINKGLALSKGKIVNWLNSDDFLLPGCLETLDMLINHFEEFDVYAFHNLNCKADGGLYNGWKRTIWEKDFEPLLKGSIFLSQESTFINVNFLKKNKITLKRGFKSSFDHVFYTEVLNKNPKILLINQFGGVMRIQPESITMQGKTQEEIKLYFSEIKKIIGKYPLLLSKLYHNNFSRFFMNVLLFLSRKYKLIPFRWVNVFPSAEYYFANCNGYNARNHESWQITSFK